MALWKDKARGVWRYEVQIDGKRYTGTGFSTKREASAAREQRRKETKTEKKTGTVFSEVANLYLDYAQRRFAKKTYDYKAMVYKNFFNHAGDMEITQITPHILHGYLNTRPSNHNYNAHRKDLCALFTFIREQLKISIPHPCWDLEQMPYTPKKKTTMSEEDVLKLIMAADPKKERPLILTIIHTLARIDELLRLTWDDVNFEKRTVQLWTRKRKGGGYEADLIPMNDDLYDVLRREWDKRQQEEWVFYNEKTDARYNRRPKLMPGLCKRAGIGNYGFHHLRHFMASYLADKEKVSKITISRLLRHKSLSTTEIYLKGDVQQSEISATKALEGKFSVCGSVCGSEEKPHTQAQPDRKESRNS